MTVLQRHNVRVSGVGQRALVFVRGFGCGQHLWRLVAPAAGGQIEVDSVVGQGTTFRLHLLR